ncbi:DEAD/DEAH box helicase [Babesia caballi]|uniref:ATP-dependent RNA helicase n=1 Tax=Babesia caballi TaxID=5871 RepID=A0AAV4LRS1_BABCB|nr:DEAD/DEAH box helicase [Babesia caballi]
MAPRHALEAFPSRLGRFARCVSRQFGVCALEPRLRPTACSRGGRVVGGSAPCGKAAEPYSKTFESTQLRKCQGSSPWMNNAQGRAFGFPAAFPVAVRGGLQPGEAVVRGTAAYHRKYTSAAGGSGNDESRPDRAASEFPGSAETRHLMRTLKLSEPDEFQTQIILWTKGYARCAGGQVKRYPEEGAMEGEPAGSAFGNVALAVGGTKTGKTTSYLLALSDAVNADRNDADGTGAQRDEYRNKVVLNRSLRGIRPPTRPNAPRVHGLPKLDWNCLMVPAAVVLVPSREIGMQVFDLSCKMQLRTRLFAGGMGYKKQTTFAGGHVAVGNRKQNDNVDVIVSTPEMLLRVIHGAFEDARLDIKFLRLLVLEEADLLCEGFYLEQLNELLNMIHSQQLRTLCVTTTKTDALTSHIQQAHLDGQADLLARVGITHPKSHTVDAAVQQVFTAIAQADPLERLLETLEELNARAGGSERKTVVFCNTGARVQDDAAARGDGLRAAQQERQGVRRARQDPGGDQRGKQRGPERPGGQRDILRLPEERGGVLAQNGPGGGDGHREHLLRQEAPAGAQGHTADQHAGAPHRVPQRQREGGQSAAAAAGVGREARTEEPEAQEGGAKGAQAAAQAERLVPGEQEGDEAVLPGVRHDGAACMLCREKATKKLQFLQKRGLLRKGHGLPRRPDRAVEASDSQEFVRMQRSADGFLQVIPRRRSRIRRAGQFIAAASRRCAPRLALFGGRRCAVATVSNVAGEAGANGALKLAERGFRRGPVQSLGLVDCIALGGSAEGSRLVGDDTGLPDARRAAGQHELYSCRNKKTKLAIKKRRRRMGERVSLRYR